MNKRSLFLRKLTALPYGIWAVLFIIVPLIFVAYYAFTDSAGNFSLDNMRDLTNPMYISIFIRSVAFALIATVLCLLIAYPLAFAISRASARAQSILIMLCMLPMWMNFLIRTYSWMALLEDTGIINGLLSAVGLSPVHMINTAGAVILGMVYNFLPYMILPIYSVMSKLDPRVIEAAQDLGCNGIQTAAKVILPLSTSGIVTGVTMVFVPSVSTFYISQKLGGGSFDLIGDSIERQFMAVNNYNLGAAMSFVLMVLIIACIAVMNKFSGDEEGEMVV